MQNCTVTWERITHVTVTRKTLSAAAALIVEALCGGSDVIQVLKPWVLERSRRLRRVSVCHGVVAFRRSVNL